MTIKAQLRLLLVIIGCVFTVMFVILLQSGRSSKQYQATDLTMSLIIKEISDINLVLGDYLIYHHDRPLTQIERRLASITKHVETLQFKDSEFRGVQAEMQQNLELTRQLFEKLRRLHDEFHKQYNAEISERIDPFVHDEIENLAKRLSLLSLSLVNSSHRLMKSLAEKQLAEFSVYYRLTVAGLVLCFFVLTLSFLMFSRRLAHLVRDIKNSTERIAYGELDHRIDSKERDEFGDLARAVDKMAVSLHVARQSYNDQYRKLQQEAAERRAAEVYARSLIEASLDPLVTINADGKITDANEALSLATGLSSEQLVGTDFYSYFTDPEAARSGYMQVFTDGAVRDYSLAIRHISGSVTDVLYNASVYRDESGQILGVFAAARDITERKKAEDLRQKLNEELEIRVRERTEALDAVVASLKSSNRELEQFAYVASHDLQEPLRMISSFTQLLAQEYKGRLDAEADEYIHYVVDGANRMQCLIQDLLSYSRVATRGKPFEPVDLNMVIGVVQSSLQVQIIEAGAMLVHDPLPTIMADSSQMTQLFQNLVSNAIKFRGADLPLVHLSSSDEGDCWHITVRDNGIGIEAQYFERIFLIFQRLHTREAYQGTGIGLAVCKRIVERHGGRIWVESEAGKGSTFHVTLSKTAVNPVVTGYVDKL